MKQNKIYNVQKRVQDGESCMQTSIYLNSCGAEPEKASRRFRVGAIYPIKMLILEV